MSTANLNKIRAIAIAIGSSPQRLERFKELQAPARPLLLIQDVRTRWNSTFDMLFRAWILRSKIGTWIRQNPDKRFEPLKITSQEWTLVQNLLRVLKPFKEWTESISQTKGATIHKGWFLLNLIAGHLIRYQNFFEQRDPPWAVNIIEALEKGLAKLMIYRGKATGEKALIYTLATILDPSIRMGQFRVSLDQ